MGGFWPFKERDTARATSIIVARSLHLRTDKSVSKEPIHVLAEQGTPRATIPTTTKCRHLTNSVMFCLIVREIWPVRFQTAKWHSRTLANTHYTGSFSGQTTYFHQFWERRRPRERQHSLLAIDILEKSFMKSMAKSTNKRDANEGDFYRKTTFHRAKLFPLIDHCRTFSARLSAQIQNVFLCRYFFVIVRTPKTAFLTDNSTTDATATTLSKTITLTTLPT